MDHIILNCSPLQLNANHAPSIADWKYFQDLAKRNWKIITLGDAIPPCHNVIAYATRGPWRDFFQLLRLTLRGRYNFMYGIATDPKAWLLMRVARFRLKKIYRIVHIHGSFTAIRQAYLPKSIKEIIVSFLNKNIGTTLLVKDADLVLCVSNASCQDVKKYFFQKKIFHLPNSIESSLFRPRKESDPCIQYDVLMIARNHPQKRIPIFIELAKLLPEVQFCLVTDNNKSSLPNLVIMSPRPRQEMPMVYRLSRLLLLPSYNEGCPLSILEAMSSGLPVIAANSGGNTDLIVNDVTGYLIPPGSDDVQNYKESVQRLLQNQKEMTRMGQKSRERVTQYFTLDRLGKHLSKVLNDLLLK